MPSEGLRELVRERYSFKGFTVGRIENLKNAIVVHLKRNSKKGTCPKCGNSVRAEEFIKRRVRGIDLIKKCYKEFKQARIRCSCGYRGMEELDFVNSYSRYTKQFEEHVVFLARRMKLADVAEMCGLDLKTVKHIAEKSLRAAAKI